VARARRNVEIKARCERPDEIRRKLVAMGAELGGTDRQRDTYFPCPAGRLKLREGEIETALIFYRRPDEPGAKLADLRLYTPSDAVGLGELLAAALGVEAVVTKRREIYFLDNVKFHIDDVDGLGRFVEIEAQGDAEADRAELHRQCTEYLRRLDIDPHTLIPGSYREMVLRETGHTPPGRQNL